MSLFAGDEIGFVSLSDFKGPEMYDVISKVFLYIPAMLAWGYDIQPTGAIKMEGLHHIATGLGLPLQITLNVTGIATMLIKAKQEGRQHLIQLEPR